MDQVIKIPVEQLSAVVFVVMIAFAGCATVDKENAKDTERLLSASGFQMRMADTPQKLDKAPRGKPRGILVFPPP
jgi:hypothetical protein